MLSGVDLFYMNEKDSPSSIITAMISIARQRVLLRVTGGSGLVTERYGALAQDVLPGGLIDFHGVMFFGGTQIRLQSNPSIIIPTVQEAAIQIKKNNPDVVALGVIPRTEIFRLIPQVGNVMISEASNLDQFTFIHPDQDICIQVQKYTDALHDGETKDDPDENVWDLEWKECKRLIRIQCEAVRVNPWTPILLSYNGGGTVKREILKWVSVHWPVILIEGSGRETEKLCYELVGQDAVYIAECNAASLRSVYDQVIQEQKGKQFKC